MGESDGEREMSSALAFGNKMDTAAKAVEGTGAQPASCPLCGGGQVRDLLVAPDRFHLRKQMYRLIRCESCSGVWLASPPRPLEMWQHYTEDYHRAIVTAGEGAATSRWKPQVK